MRISDWRSDVCSSDLRASFAELKIFVVAPGPQLAVALYGGIVLVAGCDHSPVGSAADLDWIEFVDCNGAASPQARERVIAPRPHRSVGLDSDRMLVSGGHLCPTTMFMDLNGHRTVIPITMAELAILVVTPTPEGSVRFDRHAMGAAGDGRHPIAVRTDARRHEPTGLAG